MLAGPGQGTAMFVILQGNFQNDLEFIEHSKAEKFTLVHCVTVQYLIQNNYVLIIFASFNYFPFKFFPRLDF